MQEKSPPQAEALFHVYFFSVKKELKPHCRLDIAQLRSTMTEIH